MNTSSQAAQKKPLFGIADLKKLIPMSIMIFCICFNHTILRNLKDAFVVTGTESGAAVIPFIKVWGLLPGAILSTVIFTYLTNHFSRKTVFNTMVLGFLLFFCFFAFWLYPHREALLPDRLANWLESCLPMGFRAFVDMIRHWPFTLFYVMAEVWGSIVLAVLFWGFANEITSLEEAPRFYSVFSIVSCIVPVVSGFMAARFSKAAFDPSFFVGTTAWEQSLVKIIILVVASGILTLFCFNWLTSHGLDTSQQRFESHSPKEEKKHLGFLESVAFLAKSKYLLCIAVMVLGYNLVISVVEIIWKDQLHNCFSTGAEYNLYVSKVTMVQGLFSFSFAFLLYFVIKKWGWTKTALITPFVLFITSVMFFACITGKESLSGVITLFGTSPLALAVFIGAAQNSFSRAAKYSFFDTTKEMAFIPLDKEMKLKGKAAIDGVGSRLGKSLGSCLHQGLYLIFCSVSASVPYVSVLLLAVIIFWLIAASSLGKQFEQIKQTPLTADGQLVTG